MPPILVRLLVVNFSDCYRFYRDILQLQPFWGDERGSYASFTQDQEKRPVLAIFQRQDMSEVIGTASLPLDPPAQDRAVLTIAVADVDETVRQMKQRGAVFLMEPTNFPGWGYRGAFLRDPDGYLIELSSELL